MLIREHDLKLEYERIEVDGFSMHARMCIVQQSCVQETGQRLEDWTLLIPIKSSAAHLALIVPRFRFPKLDRGRHFPMLDRGS